MGSHRRPVWLCRTVIITVTAALLTGCSFSKKKKDTSDSVTMEAPSVIGDIGENTLIMKNDGSILEVAVQKYEESVSEDELQSYIQKAVDMYNQQAGTTRVSLQEFQLEGQTARTAIEFNDIETYQDFDKVDLSVSLYNASETDAIARNEVSSRTDAVKKSSRSEEESISDEELADAGYSADDLKNGNLKEAAEDATVTDAEIAATLTDAKGQEVKADDLKLDGSLMLVMPDAMNFTFENGEVLYVNRHGRITGKNTAVSDGTGDAVIVYRYQY